MQICYLLNSTITHKSQCRGYPAELRLQGHAWEQPLCDSDGRYDILLSSCLEDHPVSKSLVTSIYQPFSPFGRGLTPVRGLTITMVIKHLQVMGWSSKCCTPLSSYDSSKRLSKLSLKISFNWGTLPAPVKSGCSQPRSTLSVKGVRFSNMKGTKRTTPQRRESIRSCIGFWDTNSWGLDPIWTPLKEAPIWIWLVSYQYRF